MARTKKGAAGSPAAVPQTATTGAPADAGAPATTIAGDPGNDPAQAVQTAAASEIVQMPGVASTVVVASTNPVPLPATEQPETKPLDGLISVKSHRPRRRAGLAFGPEAITIDTAELTDEQLEAITGDPLLEVTESE
jgi:hypothetical protein